MTARTIVTSHPDVACDVCGRRLLRGEQPEAFLAGGQRRVVCELCTTRAAHEGWRREAEEHAGRPRADRYTRGSSLLRRLRQLREPGRPEHAHETDRDGAHANESALPAEWTSIDAEWAAVDEKWGEPTTTETTLTETTSAEPTSTESPASETGDLAPPLTDVEAIVSRALEIFNAGEYPRRLAGVARALGAPGVRAVQLTSANVAIVVAWELCWYRYEVDPGDDARGAWLAAEGMELEELAEEDRIANAAIDERGMVALLG